MYYVAEDVHESLLFLHPLQSAGTIGILTSKRFALQCDGQYIPLPSLQGIAVLNIPSYAGGTNFWGGTKEDDVSSIMGFERVSTVVLTFPECLALKARLMILIARQYLECMCYSLWKV